MIGIFNPLSANITKWSNALKQFVGNFHMNTLSFLKEFLKKGEISPRWASPPNRASSFPYEKPVNFAGIPPRWDENLSYEHLQVGQPGKVG